MRIFPRWMLVLAVCGLSSTFSATAWGQQKTIIHNTNVYPVWVATGTWGEGVMSLTGGTNGPDYLQSSGWTKVLPQDAVAFNHPFNSIYVRAYSLTTKQWFQIRPLGQKPRYHRLFYKHENFKETLNGTAQLLNTVKARGGELRDFYEVAGYKNPATGRYEVRGPKIQGGMPNLPLPQAVATASFTNRTNSRVFFSVHSGGKVREVSLSAGRAINIPIHLGNPVATVKITQNQGGTLAFKLPKGVAYEFFNMNGQIRCRYK